MLYEKNQSEKLSDELFEHPTSEYRGAPFWAWNTELQKDELLWQIEQLKAMGFGGYHMHTRAGMATEYLSEEFMDLIRACHEKGVSEQMLSWLYDEDRWPSGAAGGFVTKNPRYRLKYLLFTVKKQTGTVSPEEGYEKGKPYFLTAYDVRLNPDGTLKKYFRIGEDDAAHGTKWYVYVFAAGNDGWYNGQSYVDTLSEDAMKEFIRITYESYDKAVGKHFGKTVPAIFTDEPQFMRKQALPFAASKNDINLPYTTDFADTFRKEYGIELLDHLPELLWDLPDGEPSRVRYLYHDHICERFTRAFADQCGAWCDGHGLALTGHMVSEDRLGDQTNAIGEAMRAYRSFGIPGIDMLTADTHYVTAKQCQSAVHQYGKEAMVSELYGVTGWDFDFRGHKFHGDWQAALGVTVRVPHLSWVSMKGSAKRDYPASINYQSAWYSQYPAIEDHFARVNTALTRGKPVVRVGVIHPIESYWLHYGPQENTADIRTQLHNNFNNVAEWLLFGGIDFDYISESLLPAQYEKSGDKTLRVGKMAYETVIVPGVEMLRGTTVEILRAYQNAGGKVVFLGDCPTVVDAVRSDAVRPLYENSTVAAFTSYSLLSALSDVRDLSIRYTNGVTCDHLLYQMRQDNGCRWLFIANGKKTYPDSEDLVIRLRGMWIPTLRNTQNGKREAVDYTAKNGVTEIRVRRYAYDSLLYCLEPTDTASENRVAVKPRTAVRTLSFRDKVAFELTEPNVMVLDIAEYSRDGRKFEPAEEILRIDKKLRTELGYPMADGRDVQPWVMRAEPVTEFPYLRFTFDSAVSVPAKLACEDAAEIVFNGEKIPVAYDGYFTDKSIRTVQLPALKKGKNVLVVRVPFGKRISIENCFLLGQFGVRVEGCRASVTKLPEKLAFGSFTGMGLPFYGATVVYRTEFTTRRACDVGFAATQYIGALVGVRVDGKEIGRIIGAPCTVVAENLPAGRHTVEWILYGTRVNCFNALHNCSSDRWYGPSYWYSTGNGWSYEYRLKEQGILRSPEIIIYR